MNLSRNSQETAPLIGYWESRGFGSGMYYINLLKTEENHTKRGKSIRWVRSLCPGAQVGSVMTGILAGRKGRATQHDQDRPLPVSPLHFP